jgi:hypothetical protein
MKPEPDVQADANDPRFVAVRRARECVKIAWSPIPEKAIALSEALGRVSAALRSNPSILLRISKLQEDMGCKIEEDDDKAREAACARGWSTPDEQKRIFPWGRAGLLFFLECLDAREVKSYVRDPETGGILRLVCPGWFKAIRYLRSPLDDDEIPPIRKH